MQKNKIIQLTEFEWDDFEKNHPQGSMTQSIQQYKLLKKRGRNAEILGIKNNNVVVAGAIVTFDKIHGGTIVNIEHGPLTIQDSSILKIYLEELKKYSLNKDGLFIQFSPNIVYQTFNNDGISVSEPDDSILNNIKSTGARHLPFQTGMVTAGALRWQYSKDIKGMDIQELESTYANEVKYYLKKNKQFGVKVRNLKREELNKFKQLTSDTANRIGFADKDINFYETVFDIYGDNAYFTVAEINFAEYIMQEKLVISELDSRLEVLQTRLTNKETKKNRRQFNEFSDQKKQHTKRIDKVINLFGDSVPNKNQIIAGALFIEQPQEMVYLYSGMYEQYKDYYGPYLIQDTMLKKSVENELPLYNFLGISGVFDGSDGVFKFKTEFTGRAEKMIGEFVYPIRPLKFLLYRFTKKSVQLLRVILHR